MKTGAVGLGEMVPRGDEAGDGAWQGAPREETEPGEGGLGEAGEGRASEEWPQCPKHRLGSQLQELPHRLLRKTGVLKPWARGAQTQGRLAGKSPCSATW